MAQAKPQTTFDEIMAGIGSLDDIEVYHHWVLIGIYMRPEKTAGGIILTDKTIDEDKWQGKVGAVLKRGPMAFADDGSTEFHGQTAEVGQWIGFRVSDGFSLDINGIHCRMIEDTHVKFRVKDPTMIY